MSHLKKRLRIRPSIGNTAWLVSYTNRNGSRSNLIFVPDHDGDIRKDDLRQLEVFVIAGELTQNSWSVSREVREIHQTARNRQPKDAEQPSSGPAEALQQATG